ncbi:MAG: hypothetical protein ACKVHM_07730, partial [Pseudomonadales bacterium]
MLIELPLWQSNKHSIAFTLAGGKAGGMVIGATKRKLNRGKALKIMSDIKLVGDTNAPVNLNRL